MLACVFPFNPYSDPLREGYLHFLDQETEKLAVSRSGSLRLWWVLLLLSGVSSSPGNNPLDSRRQQAWLSSP